MHFHGDFALVISLLTQAFLISTVLGNNQMKLTRLHNNYRSSLASRFGISNMNKLVWSTKMAEQARRVFNKIGRNHWRPLANFTEDDLGYNFGHTNDQVRPLETIFNQWKDESGQFIKDENACLPVDQCDNFRHMANARQTTFGCHYVVLKSVTNTTRHALVCSYHGSNHEVFDFDYAPPCTGCDSPAPFCESSLCVPCTRKGHNRCDCRKTCTAGNVTSGNLNQQTCTCDCHFNTGPNCDKPCKDQEFNEEYNFCEGASHEDCQNPELEMRQHCPLSCGFCHASN